ncbi:MAG: hypothetical protein FJZ98_04405, partial [Chloroflexi bacterium]|nr:hypothetical protein [Chloroflexota bacterium]
MILEMSRVQIWGLKQTLKQLIPVLHQFGGLQIDDVHDIPDAMIQPLTIPDELQREHEDVDILIASINGLIDLFSRFQSSPNESEQNSPNDFYSIKTKVEDLTSQIQYLNNQKKEIQDELVSLSKYSEMLKIIAPMMPASSKSSKNASLRALV